MDINPTGWGYDLQKKDYKPLEQFVGDQNTWSKESVEMKFQQTGPKEGIWVLAENWKEYKE